MAATTGYQAGTETNQTVLSYAVEAVWGTLPAVQFQGLRYTAESLSGSKTRGRPQEINATREASAAITTQEAAAGAINYALSFGTYDDLLSVLLGNDWQAAQVLVGVAGDVTLTSGTGALVSTTSGKFTAIAVGQYLRLFGFTNAVNNGVYRVTAKASNQSITVVPLSGATLVTETPAGVLFQGRASSIQNGVQFKSLWIQQQFSSALFLNYAGSYVQAWTLSGGIGQFLNGSFTIAAKSEASATVNASTGAVLAAPTGLVHDPVTNFLGIYVNDVKIAATVDSFSINASNTGAAAEYGMGSAVAAGMLTGMMEVSGTMKMYFKDFTYYARFKNETLGRVAFVTQDAAGGTYVIELPNCALMNPKVESGGPNAAVMATFDIEGNPQVGGGTITIHRLPSV